MKQILFLTGTRADFGKLKGLMRAVDAHRDFECRLFVTGMHTLKLYGYTVNEIRKAGFEPFHVFMNQHLGDPMEMVLANTITGLSRYVHEDPPDLLVVHGDRVETLAGAIVGAFTNTLVAHIEGGERSGTVDELVRHSASKLAHLHFVANEEARARLIQMGERREAIHVVGSPDIDVMMSDDLPSIEAAFARYELDFDPYALALFHPVTTDIDGMEDHAREFVTALLESGRNYVVIYPNNDEGAAHILRQYERLAGNPHFRVFPSIGFEYFLTLLEHARFVVGNSSAGIREAPVYGVRSINVGDRQANRYTADSIVDTGYGHEEILAAIERVESAGEPAARSLHFGRGDSAKRFMRALEEPALWETPRQKSFLDVPILEPGSGARSSGPEAGDGVASGTAEPER